MWPTLRNGDRERSFGGRGGGGLTPFCDCCSEGAADFLPLPGDGPGGAADVDEGDVAGVGAGVAGGGAQGPDDEDAAEDGRCGSGGAAVCF